MAIPIPFGRSSTAADVLAGLDLSQKTFLLTGCNSGIGYETMRALVARGACVLGLARNPEAARDACRSAGNSAIPVACDLADLESIARAIDTVRSMSRPLDAVIASAGIMASSQLQLRYGVEMQFLVNYLGHFALVNGLVDNVRDQTGRVVIVSSSGSINQAPKEGIAFNNLDGHFGYEPFAFYGQSKLACAIYAKELSRRLASRGISVNSLHPGAVGGTGLQRGFSFPLSLIQKVASKFMKSVPQGAATQALLAASPLVAGITGEYWADCQITKGSIYLQDPAMANKLWMVSKTIASHGKNNGNPEDCRLL